VDVGGGYYNLVSQKSGKALTITTPPRAAAPSSSMPNREAIPTKSGSWSVRAAVLQPDLPKSGMALDNSGSITDGTALVQGTLQFGNSNQQWSFEFVGIPQARIAAASYNSASSGIQTQTCSEGGQNVDNITNGSYTVYNNMNMSGITGFRTRWPAQTRGQRSNPFGQSHRHGGRHRDSSGNRRMADLDHAIVPPDALDRHP